MRRMIASVAVMLLAGCDSAGIANEVLAEANASGNVASTAEEKTVQRSNAAALPKEQALALIEQRQENFEKIGNAIKVISRELKGEKPNLSQVRTGATAIAQLSPQVPAWFPAGTGPNVGKTEAHAQIWQKPEDFAAKSQAFQEAAVAFNTAAQGSDLASIRAAYANLGKSCKGCHDLYREED